jgi:hypothetical protein
MHRVRESQVPNWMRDANVPVFGLPGIKIFAAAPMQSACAEFDFLE